MDRGRTGKAVARCLMTAAVLGAVAIAHPHSEEEADPADLSFKYATPIVDVTSVERSIGYYTEKLGFTRRWEWPDDDPDKTFAAIANGEVTIFLAETAAPIRPVWIFYNVNSADAVHAAYVEAGVTILEAPNDKPWGSREFLAADPDGNVLRIASEPAHEHQAGSRRGRLQDHVATN